MSSDSDRIVSHINLLRKRVNPGNSTPSALGQEVEEILQGRTDATGREILNLLVGQGVMFKDLRNLHDGRFDQVRIAYAIRDHLGPKPSPRSISLFQKEAGADGGEAAGVPVRTKEEVERNIIRRALWGNEQSEETKIKLTGGRAKANETQVAGSHYRQDTVSCPNCGEPIQHWDIYCNRSYLEGQITKYLWRWQSKNGIEDLKKARHFLDKMIEKAVMEEPCNE